jgi:N-acetylglucosaminyldiphosphoundecaprenol N-acetyl-beta-D-mannosaminyltransferase
MPSHANVLGVAVSALNMELTLTTIEQWVRSRQCQYVCVTGVHGVMESYREPAVRTIHNRAGLVTPDGMPLVWLLRWAGFREADRVYGPDLMLEVFARSKACRYRHFLYGASTQTLEALRANLERRFPEAVIVGTHSPPFRALTSAEGDAIVDRINDSGADIVWVGLSTPAQERWMAEYRARLTSPVLIGVGAAFDFHAGTVRQAPRLIQRSGLEWAFRLAMEPRRLWKRYFTNNPQFIGLVLAQKLGWRRFPL